MIFWPLFNTATAIAAAMALVYMLLAYEDRFRFLERIVLIAMSSSMVLRVGPILGKDVFKGDSPFDYWSVSILQLSFLIGALCVIARLEDVDIRHLAGKLIRKLRRH